MATKFGKWFRRTARLVTVNAVNTVLVQSGTSLTALKEVAKTKANDMQVESADKQLKADALLAQVNILTKNSGEITEALEELGAAEGK